MHNKSSKNGSQRFWPTPKANEKVQSPEAHAKGFYALREAVEMPDYTQTSSPSTEPTTPGLTCSQGDFLANLSVSPGSEEARKMSVRSGRKCSELLTRQDPLGSLVRMLLESSRWNSTISYLTWKPSATPRGRLLFRLVPSMPDTEGTEFGLWPTPSVCGNHNRAGASPTSGDGLATKVKMWPRPTQQDGENNGGPSQWKRNSIPLNVAVLANRFQEAGAKSSLPPSAILKAMDSARADSTTQTDAVSQGQPKTDTNTPSETEFSTDALKKPESLGSLNPNWVEWLMGYPIGHTACEGWATPSSHKSRKKSSEQSPA